MVLAAQEFREFSAQHFLLIGIFLAGCVVLATVGRRHRGHDETFRRVFAVVVPCVAVPTQLDLLRPSVFDIETSLPLNLCDLAWMVATYALWTKRPWATALTYYWGLTLSVQGIITPSLGHTFPDVQYFGFWGVHFLVVWSAVYLTWGLGCRPDWRSYRVAVVATTLWAIGAMVLNELIGTNYGYLNGKPDTASLLDLLGPWPLYVVIEVGLILAGWALITWPWTATSRSSPPAPRRAARPR
jgi:hypothetical integral membrane protein (TIGR02206 family)